MKPTRTSIVSVSLLLALIALATLTGCATNGYQPQQSGYYEQPQQSGYYEPPAQQRQPMQQSQERYGAIDSIQVLRGNGGNGGTSGAGAVVGGIAGAVLGNQVGGGSGRKAATVLGAIGGAMVGNNVEQNRSAATPDTYRLHVRLENGDGVTVVQESLDGLRMGSRVRVVNGRAYAY
ncbi:outer membrane lipoprotein SlyB [Janthinobacterium sp. CG_23.3]|uniref:glycine zipper 2TM domain-containing protein n=1 Tax=unclassified Janthinobacterium TaxID=2610881 RepID=UPI00034BD677|nr:MULTISPECIES: glycine zipper 2TM domain-containing protein [unclassified Janthinobacterium]MEC5162340.1 outer membrane lipoprotein SlyB [Janthinobacterium sp. CG_S6]